MPRKTKRRTPPPAVVTVGHYQLANYSVELRIDFESGDGCFSTMPKAGQTPRITVGVHHAGGGWRNTLGVLVHEAMEMVLAWEGTRYDQDDGWGANSAGHLFVFDHNTFCRCADMVGHFLAACLPDFSTAYNRRMVKKGGRRA